MPSGGGVAPVEVVEAASLADGPLRAQLVDLWVAVTDAGGSVGFAPPADRDAIEGALDAELAPVGRGRDSLAIVRGDESVVAMGFLRGRDGPLFTHWRTVMRLMVHPDQQGTGVGGRLLDALHRLARARGCDHLQLTIRDGEGLERFYRRHGYRVVGRHPGAVRLGPDDERDEVMLVADLLDGP